MIGSYDHIIVVINFLCYFYDRIIYLHRLLSPPLYYAFATHMSLL